MTQLVDTPFADASEEPFPRMVPFVKDIADAAEHHGFDSLVIGVINGAAIYVAALGASEAKARHASVIAAEFRAMLKLRERAGHA